MAARVGGALSVLQGSGAAGEVVQCESSAGARGLRAAHPLGTARKVQQNQVRNPGGKEQRAPERSDDPVRRGPQSFREAFSSKAHRRFESPAAPGIPWGDLSLERAGERRRRAEPASALYDHARLGTAGRRPPGTRLSRAMR